MKNKVLFLVLKQVLIDVLFLIMTILFDFLVLHRSDYLFLIPFTLMILLSIGVKVYFYIVNFVPIPLLEKEKIYQEMNNIVYQTNAYSSFNQYCYFLTNSYILSTYSFKVIKIEEIEWMYGRTHLNRSFYDTLCIYDKKGTEIELYRNSAYVDEENNFLENTYWKKIH